ncbi:nephrocystin-4 isoform X2 [Lingula anatina]|uniref:Nephrocystin-4 isoform X2 n=1 Tax=Lingula anatina TaxID=7574 RepID=A0A1S3IWX5_LINAN|nr:nephrocystin-4 isoform X2 [Lingula anatina]|eukprot:XP_013402548.1 nephrocystin-4 isoform X2 [Lingula anatina]
MATWKDFIKKNPIIPPPYDRQKRAEEDSYPFCLSIKIIDGIPIKDEDKKGVHYQLRLSLFDVTYKQFFGRTWIGPESTAKSTGQKFKVNFNQNVYFHTTLNDLSIVLVVELVAVSFDKSGHKRHRSCGWGMVRIFKYEGEMEDTSSGKQGPSQRVDLYHGTPRALLYLEDPIESNELLQLIKGCQLSYSIRTHRALQKVFHLLPENVIVGNNSVVPGIAEGAKDPENPGAGVENLKKPKLLKQVQCYVDKVNIMLYPNVEKFEEELCRLCNEDRINREHRVADGSNVTVSERRLLVGVHNGWCYVQDPQVAHLVPDSQAHKKGATLKRGHQRSASTGSIGSSSCVSLVLRNSIPLDGMVEDPMMSIVFLLEYVVSEPMNAEDRKLSHSMVKSQTHTVAVRWAVWSPFSAGGQQEVTISLIGGPTPMPNEVFMYKGVSLEDSNVKNAPGNLAFNFVVNKKKAEGISGAGSQVSLQYPTSSLVRGHSMESVNTTEDGSTVLQALPTAGLSGRPPLPGRGGKSLLQASSRDVGKIHTPSLQTSAATNDTVIVHQDQSQSRGAGPMSLQVPQGQPYGSPQDMPFNQSQPYPPMQPPYMMAAPYTQGYGMPFAQGPGFVPPYSLPNTYSVEISHLRDPGSARDGTDLQELPFTPVHAPILATTPNTRSGQGLSRAAYARLYTAGFPPILDRFGEAPEVVDPADHVTFDPAKEETDPLVCNEIYLQFLAFAKYYEQEQNTKSNGTVFFTFQFYRFPQVTSERLLLGAQEGDLSQQKEKAPYILQKLEADDTVKKGPPGYQVKYFVDPSFLKPGEAKLFLKHLSQQVLHIDVWDGESLLLIGSCAVDLSHLCRQGRDALQVTYELDVMITEYSEDQGDTGGEGAQGTSVRPVGVNTSLKGRLHLRLANVGHPADKKTKLAETEPALPLKKSRLVVASEGANSSGFLGGSLNAGLAQSHNSGLRKSKVARAQHVTETHRELASVLVTRRDPMTSGVDDTENMDPVKRRKLARMMAIRQLQQQQQQPSSERSLPLSSYKQLKQERTRDLKTIDLYRQQTKQEGILTMLNSAITAQHNIYPSLGTSEFFEFVLRNPYNVQHTITIEWTDPELYVVTDAREWRYFKQLNEVHTPLEEAMFNLQSSSQYPQVFLRPKETLNIPFKYLSYRADHSVQPQGPINPFHAQFQQSSRQEDALATKVVKVYFKTEDNRPISILALNVDPIPHVVDQTFRFHHPEQSFLKKSIRLPPFQMLPGAPIGGAGLQQLFVRCSDNNVICETRPVQTGEPQDVFIKVACGASPQVKKFFLAIYSDPFLSKPLQIWQFFVHSLQRVDATCVEGQTSRFSLILRGTQASRLVKCFSSHPYEMSLEPKDPFMLAANAVHELHVGVRAVNVGSKFMYINVVDIEFHQLVRTWLVNLSCRSPVVSKAFELKLPVGGGKGCNKRISYTNPYPHKKVFHLRTNRSDLLQFKDTRLEIGGGEPHTIGLRFAPAQTPGMTEILIFINDDDDKNEETFCVKAVYMVQ